MIYLEKQSTLATVLACCMVLFHGGFALLALYHWIPPLIVIPMATAAAFSLFLLLEKRDSAKSKLLYFVTVLPFISLSVIPCLKA